MPSPTPIALLLPNLVGGGAERVVVNLAREFVDRGHAVDLVLMAQTGELLEIVPGPARVVDLAAPRVRRIVRPLVRYLRQERPQALLVSMWPLTTLAVVARLLARSTCRLILIEHTVLSRHYADYGALHRILLRATTGLSYRFADARVAVSRGSADDLSILSGLRRDRIEVIHNPVPAFRQSTGEEAAEAVWGVPRGRRILAVGSLKVEKNHALLIRAFARIAKFPDARLLVLGEGDQRPKLMAAAVASGVGDQLLMPGFVVDPSPYFRTADLFVLSSDYEGLPTVIVEALGCGLPVVSTDCPAGPAEILDSGRYGRLVPVGDAEALALAIEEMLAADHDSAELMRRAADFAPAVAADRYLTLCQPGGHA